MIETGFRMRAFFNPGRGCVDIHLGDVGEDLVAVGLDLQPRAKNTMTPALVCLPEFAAQELINDLWAAGFRPAEAKNTADQVNAIEAHLQDMRQIAFDKMKVPKP